MQAIEGSGSCLIYYDPKKLFGSRPEASAALSECAGYDKKFKESGYFVSAEALEIPENAMTVQGREGKMSTVDGPFMETKDMPGESSSSRPRSQQGGAGGERSSAGAHRLARGPAGCRFLHRSATDVKP
ncbi:YciI family protein [uncultured Nitratireductor sp.]|uniref:YciI family protein n=1 Tax=uncultured Nitratireductor sp. TaxID=520953 RepID=UPI0025EADA26|nr:YciI family protein [uncultured Nitratireductor sp.]